MLRICEKKFKFFQPVHRMRELIPYKLCLALLTKKKLHKDENRTAD